jgi:hypothetical protein
MSSQLGFASRTPPAPRLKFRTGHLETLEGFKYLSSGAYPCSCLGGIQLHDSSDQHYLSAFRRKFRGAKQVALKKPAAMNISMDKLGVTEAVTFTNSSGLRLHGTLQVGDSKVC